LSIINNMAMIDTIIVGAGSGTRLGYSTPKAFVELCGKPLLYYSLKTFCSHQSVNRIILVVSPTMIETAKRFINEHNDFANKVAITVGGAERWQSVRNGVSLSDGEWVLIHDAARPVVTRGVIDSLLALRENFDCAITATPEVDTVRMIEDGSRCGATLDRSKLLRVGTPQLFRREKLLASFDKIDEMTSPPTDEAALFERLGIPIGYSLGEPVNFKITTKTDLEIALALIEKRGSDGR